MTGRVDQEDTLIAVVNSSLTMSDSYFHNVTKHSSGTSILSAIASKVVMENIRCSKYFARNGLIKICNGSYMQLKNSVFDKNGHFVRSSAIISLQYNSTVSLLQCKFTNNDGLFGSCINSSDNTTILISNTNFGMNLAWMGGVIFVINTVDKIVPRGLKQKSETLWSKQELENGTTDIIADDDVLSDSSPRSTCIVENTDFTNNRAVFEGGIFYVYG